MSRWIILSVAVVALTAATTFLTQYVPEEGTQPIQPVVVENGPRPKVEVEEPLVHEFGVMSQQKKDSHSWKIKNTGEGDLELWLDGKTTCSCTVASLPEGEKKIVKKGEATTIELEWNTKTFSNEYSQGATIGTNDPSRPRFSLGVKGKVYPPIMVFPPEMIVFTSISNEETNRARIAVTSPDKPDLQIKKITTSRPALIVTKVVPLSEEDQKQLKFKGGHRIDVELKPGMPQGQFHDELVIETDHPQRPELKVSIAGHVTGPVSVVPDRLRLPNVISRLGTVQYMTLMVRGGTPTKFEVTHKPDKVQVAIAESTDSAGVKGRYRMTVTIPPGTAAGSVNDEIILKTDHPKVSEVKIPVNIFVSNAGQG